MSEIKQDQVNKIKEIKERFDHESDIVNMVHNYMITENKKSQERRIQQGRLGKFYPSSVGQCKRQVVYQMLGYPAKPTSGQSLLVMENGTSFHNRMEDIFEKMGIMIAPELSLKDKDLKISGRSDAIIWNYLLEDDAEDEDDIVLYDPKDKTKEVYHGPANHILIVEFKSIKSKNFAKLPKNKPIKKNEMQLQLYFYLTGIRSGLVYYENKDTQETKYYYVTYNQSIVDETIEYIKECISYADKNELPEQEGNPLDVMCRYCNFRDICHTPLSEENWLDLYFNDDDE